MQQACAHPEEPSVVPRIMLNPLDPGPRRNLVTAEQRGYSSGLFEVYRAKLCG